MALQSAVFSIEATEEQTEATQQMLSEAEVIFCKDPLTGIGPEGYGYCLPGRIDENHIRVRVSTSPEVMEMLLLDPRLTLLEKCEGWPEELEEEDAGDIPSA